MFFKEFSGVIIEIREKQALDELFGKDLNIKKNKWYRLFIREKAREITMDHQKWLNLFKS